MEHLRTLVKPMRQECLKIPQKTRQTSHMSSPSESFNNRKESSESKKLAIGVLKKKNQALAGRLHENQWGKTLLLHPNGEGRGEQTLLHPSVSRSLTSTLFSTLSPFTSNFTFFFTEILIFLPITSFMLSINSRGTSELSSVMVAHWARGDPGFHSDSRPRALPQTL